MAQKINTKTMLFQMPCNVLLAAVIASIFSYIASIHHTRFLEKELVRVDKEIQQKENVFQTRQAALVQECEQNKLQVKQLRNEQ